MDAKRFQIDEDRLVKNLKLTLNQFNIPLIIVRTFSYDDKIDQEMKDYLNTQGLDVNNFVRVLSRNSGNTKAFGLDKLFKLTLKKYREASNGYLKQFMIKKISNYIINNIAKSNSQNIKLIQMI